VQENFAQMGFFVQENPYFPLIDVNFVCANGKLPNKLHTFAADFLRSF
jgi:hypothetical protein